MQLRSKRVVAPAPTTSKWPTLAQVNALIEVEGGIDGMETFLQKMTRQIASGCTPFEYRLYGLVIAQSLIHSDVYCQRHFLEVMNLFRWKFHEFESPPFVVTNTINELNRCIEDLEC
jgi:hypothetical protein